MTLSDCNHLAHVIVLWQIQKFIYYYTVFDLFYFVFEGTFPVQAPRGLHSEGRFNKGFFALQVWGAYIWKSLQVEGLIFGILWYVKCNYTQCYIVYFALFCSVLYWIVFMLVWFERSLHSAQVSGQSCPWPLKLMTSHGVEGTWIPTGGSGRLRGAWVILIKILLNCNIVW